MNVPNYKTPSQHSVGETGALTKRASENETDPTLPNPEGEPHSNPPEEGLLDGSVMWDGPEPSGEGARSAVPAQQSQCSVDIARGVTEQPTGDRLDGSGAALAQVAAKPMHPLDTPAYTSGTPTNFNVSEESANEGFWRKPSTDETDFANDHGDAKPFDFNVPLVELWSRVQLSKARGMPLPTEASDPATSKALAVLDQRMREEMLRARMREEAKERAQQTPVRSQETMQREIQSAFDVVRDARARIREIDAQRAARKDTEAGASTIRNYEKILHRLDMLYEHYDTRGHTYVWVEVFADLQLSSRSFNKYRTALKWRVIKNLKALLSEQDKLQRRTGQDGTWLELIRQLQVTLHELQTFERLSFDEYNGEENHPPVRLEMKHVSHSKKAALPKLPDGWQDRFLLINEHSPSYRHAGVLLRFCGLRPEELAHGVNVRWSPHGVIVRIRGAKVRSTAGQPWRCLVLKPESLPGWFVDELRENRSMRIHAQPDALRAHLNRMSARVFNPEGRKNGCKETLSAYVFRHALVTQMREAGWDSETIAASIGERSAETTRIYGRRVRGGRSLESTAIDPELVKAARPVKPVDLKALQEVSGNKAASMQPKPQTS